MNFYLSSFGLGDQVEKLRELAAGRRLGFVPNAMDHIAPAARTSSNAQGIAALREIRIESEELDLRGYFAAPHLLRSALSEFGGV